MTPKNNNSNIKDVKDVINNFEDNFEQIKNKYSITLEKPEEDEMVKYKINQTIAKYAAIEDIPIEFAVIGISALLQSGAYLKSVPNRKIKINTQEFTKKSLVFAADQAENNYTLRVMARYLKNTIAKVADHYNIPGHLYARFKIENADLIANSTPETRKLIATYCTDFQIENPDTPSVVRQYLSTREKNRTNKK